MVFTETASSTDSLVGCDRSSAAKHCGVWAAVEGRLSVEYLAIRHLVPFSHQNRRFGWRFSL
jgi:hypothetical protein